MLRHAPLEGGPDVAVAEDPVRRAALQDHYERFLGPIAGVWHEIVSDLVHIDVCVWRPTEDRPMFTFATVGMSDRAMSVPQGAPASPYAELMLCLPPDWPVPLGDSAQSPWADELAYMPIRSLKTLARSPHDYRTWFARGHTIPNGDPPQLLPGSTTLSGWMLLPPVTLPSAFAEVASEAGQIDIFGVWFVTANEMRHNLARGIDSLYRAFEHRQVSELLDLNRRPSL